ncbi:MAG: CRISPR-associated endonuclease Cas2 [Candidatus Syntropharchaeia archaeon]
MVSYDIIDDRKRAKLAEVVLDYGKRVQKSVFECHVSEREFLEMKERIEKIIDMEVDSVRYYFLCQRCIGQIQISGSGTIVEEEDTIIV